MNIPRGESVLVDTNVILEAHRTACWKHLAGFFRLKTADACVVECATGNQKRGVAVPVDIPNLRATAHVERVGEEQVAELRFRLAGRVSLDSGEEALIAYACRHPDAWVICSPDKAAVRACFILGFLDRVVALEDLTESSGIAVDLRRNYTRNWLANFRTDLLLEL
jgi:hypothetical protein